MAVLPIQYIWEARPIEDMIVRTKAFGLTYGAGPAGYDVRVGQLIHILGGEFNLASTLEKFRMPHDLIGVVHDKSTWARKGLAVQNTIIEPGWRGYLTLELTNHSKTSITIEAGTPIAQIIFHRLEAPTQLPYPEDGKYMDQSSDPQSPIFE